MSFAPDHDSLGPVSLDPVSPDPVTLDPVTLDHVGLSVGDLDAQSRWYAEAFSLAPTGFFEIPPLGLRGVFLVGAEPGGLTLELLERDGSQAQPVARDQAESLLTRGIRHLCVRVTDVDAAHARLIGLGAETRMPPQASPEPGVRMCFVADPEGNLIEVIDRGQRVRL
jgi:catechol 2,3-dioxygenase-like lactoylglutathione lyase family enzyme